MKSIVRSALIYAVLGPPIGAFVTVFILVFAPFVFGRGSLQDISDLPQLLLIGLAFSYVLGGVQAAFVGAIVGFLSERFNSKKLAIPIVASIIGCLVFLFIVFNGPWSHGLRAPWTSESIAGFSWRMLFFLFLHVIPAICVWLIQCLWSRRQPT